MTPVVNGALLKGRVAVVTGSTSGIGLGVASAVAAHGAAVLLKGFGSKAATEAALRVAPDVRPMPLGAPATAGSPS